MERFILVVLFFSNKIFKATSKIPIQPYYHDLTTLNEAIIIKMKFNTFRKEVQNIYRNLKTIDNDLFFTGLSNFKHDWTRLYLKWFKRIDPIGSVLCPESTAIIHSMPNIQTAMFSVLKPGAKIVPHRGPYCGCIRLHMGLITPNDDNCFINLDGKSYSWRDGEVILLDDSYEHYVENNTNEYRVILFCDIIRPMHFIGDIVNEFLINNISEYTHRET